MACLINTCIFRTACCLNAQCGNASPGNLWALPDSQQDVLSVNENCPTGKTENEQNENSPLEIYSHLLKVATSVGLLKKKRTQSLSEQRWNENANEKNLVFRTNRDKFISEGLFYLRYERVTSRRQTRANWNACDIYDLWRDKVHLVGRQIQKKKRDMQIVSV